MGEDKREKKTRGRGGDGALYKDKDGYYTAAISLPAIGGKRRRKVKRSKSRAVAAAALREWREQLHKSGDLKTNAPTVGVWFRKWIRIHVQPNLKPRTTETYRGYVENCIIPGLGENKKIDRLNVESIRAMSLYLYELGRSTTTARNAHHYAAKALDVAVREGIIYANPARLAEPPRRAVASLDVMSLPEAIYLLEVLSHRPDGALWATYLLTGARRGEIAGLEIDRVGDHLDLSWQLQRFTYQHGCDGECGHKRGVSCPQRTFNLPADFEHRQVQGGLHLSRPKSRAGWRVIPLVEPLKTILEWHIKTSPPNPWGLMFSEIDEDIIYPPDPDRISRAWKALMADTFGDKRHVRLHDVRHTTVDLLYEADVPEDIIQEIVGHSNRSMSRAYKSKGNRARLLAAMNQLSELLTRPSTPAVSSASRPALE